MVGLEGLELPLSYGSKPASQGCVIGSMGYHATLCTLIHYYVHKKKRLNERYLLSLDATTSLADQDVQKLVEKRFEREKASYDTSYTTHVGIAQTAL